MEETTSTMDQYIQTPNLPLRPNYLATVKGAVGSEMFRQLWLEKDGQLQDILEDGLRSCAFFVSSILSMPNLALLKAPHATVEGLVRGLKAANWEEVSAPSLPGEIIIWEKMAQAGGEEHLHAGFYMGGAGAISHVDSTRTPQKHDVTFRQGHEVLPQRKIIAVYTHTRLEE